MAKQWCFIFLWQTHFVAFFFQFKVILMLHYGKIPESSLPSSKGAAGVLIPRISELILHATLVLNIPWRCALKSRAMNTPMKNDAFKTGVNLKVLFIIRRINIDFNSLPTHHVISLATQHRCKQGWCHTFSPRSETWVGRQAWKLALQTLIGLKLLATTDQ